MTNPRGNPGNKGNPKPAPRSQPPLTPYQEKILKSQGYIPTRCKGFNRADETGERVRCKQWAIRGGEVCKTHGGTLPNVKKKAAAVLRDEAVKKAMVTYGLPLKVSPQVALMEELARTNGHIAWLSDKIQSMEAGDLIWGQIEESKRSGYEDENNWDEEKVGAVMHLWVQLYFRERQHLARIADLMVKNGLSAIQLRLQERQLDLMESGLLSLAKQLGHKDDEPRVRQAIALALRQMSEAAREPLEIESK